MESPNSTSDTPRTTYTVVARRFRPQTFDELIGQGHVSRALCGAIESGRVGHAYLFTGARGVGKTSAARIFAKALNCERGPTTTPCGTCDVCQRIAAGDDVDVLEIDGASNRGIDEIRQLRQNAGVRPSRARYKIYIIDEVHMLTREAFNALLKTLEEPPSHVKFIFCTTEANKIPITILSRCQRFDFAGVPADAIVARLAQICQAEAVEADADALAEIARRANGSMRDSQSLLEQLLGAAAGGVTLDEVHALLGTAGSERVGKLLEKLIDRDAAGALAQFDEALDGGVDPGQLVAQLVEYLRDAMVVAVGGREDLLLHPGQADRRVTSAAADQLGLETLMAVLAILDHTLSRLRQSTHVRTLVEIALVRSCQLEDLDALADLVAQLKAADRAETRPAPASSPRGRTASGVKKNDSPKPAADHGVLSQSLSQLSQSGAVAQNDFIAANKAQDDDYLQGKRNISPEEPTPRTSAATAAPPGELGAAAALDATAVDGETIDRAWQQVVAELQQNDDPLATYVEQYANVRFNAPDSVCVTLTSDFHRTKCEQKDACVRFEASLAAALGGHRVRLHFDAAQAPPGAQPPPAESRKQRQRQLAQHPMVARATELFDAEVVGTPRKAR